MSPNYLTHTHAPRWCGTAVFYLSRRCVLLYAPQTAAVIYLEVVLSTIHSSTSRHACTTSVQIDPHVALTSPFSQQQNPPATNTIVCPGEKSLRYPVGSRLNFNLPGFCGGTTMTYIHAPICSTFCKLCVLATQLVMVYVCTEVNSSARKKRRGLANYVHMAVNMVARSP